MYWHGHLAINPAHLTTLRRKPTKGFRRFAEILSVGLLSENEEHETFTAVAILQELNSVLRSLGITDLVRFSKDDSVIYEDKESQHADDLHMLIERAEDSSRSSDSSLFQSMSLLLEHHLERLALVIEIRIVRTHPVGFYPIQIVVNGLAADFAGSGGADEVADKMSATFAEQDSYDRLTGELRDEFEGFMNELELAVRQRMQIDDLHKGVRAKIIRPRDGVDGADASMVGAGSQSSGADPVFDRYHSSSDMFIYCWMWSSMLHSNQLHVQDATVVDEAGQAMFDINSVGIDAGLGSVLDPAVPMSEAEISSWDGIHSIDPDLSRNWNAGDVGDAGATDGGGWLSDFGLGGGDSAGADAGCSGASCGGGCGGGCGS